jgi:hypothetical protein
MIIYTPTKIRIEKLSRRKPELLRRSKYPIEGYAIIASGTEIPEEYSLSVRAKNTPDDFGFSKSKTAEIILSVKIGDIIKFVDSEELAIEISEKISSY